MKKDVIYIDIEDDITAIIGKVKAASAKIVALVPPKRVGVLQSAVNLKLLQKSALGVDKRVVLITNDNSLVSLAAGVKIPVAKNLQSKPEIPQIAALQVDDNDVINGEELPVGEIADAAAGIQPKPVGSAADEISDKIDFSNLSDKPAPKPVAAAANKSAGKKGKVNIPNFNIFRKRFFLLGAGGLLLILFLVWALVIAPSATITINAKTTAVNIDRNLTLEPGLQQSKVDELKLKPSNQQIKKSASVEFDATGTKDIGEKATGSVTLSNGSDSDPITVPAGTTFTAANGQKFASASGVTVPGAKVSGGTIVAGTATVAVAAAAVGPEYNIAAQSYSVQGFGNLGASGTAMAGGTKEKVTVVSDDDVAKAKEKLAQQDTNAVKDELRKKFTGETIVVEESFTTEAGAPAVSPKVGEQAKKAKLTLETTYTLIGLSREDVKKVLADVLKDALNDKPNQSIFSDGSNSIQFQGYQKLNNGAVTTRLVTTGYIGTTIDTKQLADQIKGKKQGEIEQIANQIPGVDKVDIKFSPFWVTNAPSNTEKITIRFTVVNDAR